MPKNDLKNNKKWNSYSKKKKKVIILKLNITFKIW